MAKCKNIECKNNTEGKRVYCSLQCRNYYVNKYIRDYNKNSKGLAKDAKKVYEDNPKYCLNPNCGEKITYKKRRNQYCNSSCQASVTGVGRIVSESTREKHRLSRLKQIGDYKKVDCKWCGSELLVMNRRLYCDSECRRKYNRKNMDEFLIYKADTKFGFNLGDYPKEFNFGLIEEHGWYSPTNSRKPNIGGISRDHMLSVREGFNSGIDPKLLSHPANCKLMIHGDNISKNKKSSITEEELKERIKEWNKKYGAMVTTG